MKYRVSGHLAVAWAIATVFACLAAPARASGPEYGSYANIERCYDLKRSAQERIAECTNVLEAGLLPRDSAVAILHDLGIAYLQIGDYEHAKASFDTAIKYQPNMWQAYSNRAIVEDKLGDSDGANADRRAAAALGDDNPTMLNNVCWALAIKSTALNEALADCNKSLQLRANDANVLNSRALVEFRMGNLVASIADNDAAIAVNPKLKDALYLRGIAKLKSGDTVGGSADVEAAKAVDPKIADTYAGYGVTP